MEMPSVDFAELKRRCKTTDFLRTIGWTPNVTDGDQQRGWCPMHSHANGKSRSFWVRCSDGWWYCHVCKTGGSVLDLALQLLAPTMLDAARELCRALDVAVPYLQRSPANRRERNKLRKRRGVWGA
jgi:DNA primase